MHRRTLIMRRFGEMSFGLGYVEDGVWVDHAIAVARGEDLLASGDRDAVAAGEPRVDGVKRHAVGRGRACEQILSLRDGDGMVDPDAILDVAHTEAHLAEPAHDQCPSMHAAPSSV